MKRAAIILSLLTPLNIFLNNQLNAETFYAASLGYSVAIGIFILVKLITNNNLYSYLAILIFASWTSHSSGILFLMVLAIQIFIMILFEIYYLQKNNLVLFLAGFMSTYIFPLGQSLANSTILSSFVFMIFGKEIKSLTAPYFYFLGFCWGVITLSLTLLVSGSFEVFLSNQWLMMSQLGTFQIFRLDFSAIFSAIILFSALLILVYRRKFRYMNVILLLIFNLIIMTQNNTLGAFPVAMMSLLGIPLAIIARFNGFINLKLFMLFTSLLVILFGVLFEF